MTLGWGMKTPDFIEAFSVNSVQTPYCDDQVRVPEAPDV